MPVHLVMGPMFSGKTRAIMEEARKAVLGMKTVSVIKHARDTRYDRVDLAASHDGMRMRALAVDSLVEDPVGFQRTDVIVIDEGQFMRGLAGFCERHSLAGATVYVAALNSDAQRAGWPEVLALVPRATTVRSLTATCALCYRDAECSRAIGDRGAVGIGGAESYIATCAACFERPITLDVLERRQSVIDQVDWLTCVD